MLLTKIAGGSRGSNNFPFFDFLSEISSVLRKEFPHSAKIMPAEASLSAEKAYAASLNTSE